MEIKVEAQREEMRLGKNVIHYARYVQERKQGKWI